jgi:hypothetical protein
VNIAFLREDMRADPQHLNRVLQSLLGISEQVVDNALEIGAAISQTSSQTFHAAKPILEHYVAAPCPTNPKDQACEDGYYRSVWQGIVTVLYKIAKDPSSATDFAKELQENGSYAWLDGVSFKTPRNDYTTRLAKFISLAAEIQLFSQIRGPTVLKFRTELGLDQRGADFTEGEIQPHEINAIHNAIEAVKLGFIDQAQLAQLLQQAGGGADGLEHSKICASTPHIACDVVQSLDDPGNIRGPVPQDADLGQKPDAELGLVRWYSNLMQWSPDRGVWQDPAGCKLTLTDFPLASTKERVTALYDKTFQLPSPCRPINDLRVTGAYATTVALAWTAPPGASEYQLERRSVSSGFVRIGNPGASATTYLDFGLTPETTYWYRLRIKIGEELRYSNWIMVRTTPRPPISTWFPAIQMLLE